MKNYQQNSTNSDKFEFKLSDLGSLPFPLEHFDVDSFVKFIINPQDTSMIINMQKGLVASPRRAEMIEHVYKILSADKDYVQLLNEKYIPKFPTMAELNAFPDGSFGKAVANHLTINGIELDFAGLDVSVFANQELTIMGYLNLRALRTHDLYHVILGLGTSPLEEYALASFTLAQFASPYHMILVAAGYLHTAFKTPNLIPKFLSEIHRHFEMGKKAKSFIGFKFEEHFASPIVDVQKMLDLHQ